MSAITVTGGKRLEGVISLQGAKNSALPVLAATVLCNGICIIHNCPMLSDVGAAIKILQHLGAYVETDENTVTVDASHINNSDIPDKLMREMRSSIVFLGAIAARTGKAVLSSPGGCELGPRPIDLHLSSLRELGLSINEDHGLLNCECPKGLHGAEIALSFPSVGATENVILAAVTAKGITRIHNPAREPEISDLCDFLNGAGAEILGAGSDLIEINGVRKLGSTEHNVIPDRITAATYFSAVAATGGRIIINEVVPAHFMPVISVLKNAGCEITIKSNSVILTAPKRLSRVPVIRTMPYPGFPTDAGPPIISALGIANGSSMFVENIFENRYKFVDELNRFGAKVTTNARVAVIEGVNSLSAADVECTDLRGGAAMIIAALTANGKSEITKAEHIYRGYYDITGILSSLGADISAKGE